MITTTRRILRVIYWTLTFQVIKRVREERAVRQIRESDLFDEDFYREGCPELAQLGLDPVRHYVRSGADEGRWPSPLFDPQFYLKSYPDVADAGINPLLHFATCGVAEERWPNALFDSSFYLRECPFLVEMEMNPLVHYRAVGAATGRRTHPRFDPVAYAEAHPEATPGGIDSLVHCLRMGELPWPASDEATLDASSDAPLRPRIAVVLHLFYIDLWDEIACYLENVGEPFDLFVSLCSQTQYGVEERIRSTYPHATIRVFENRGRDIGPLLEFLREPGLREYELVCKIHSKKSPHRLDGGRWRGDLLHRVLGSRETVAEIIDVFEKDPRLGLLGPISSLDRSEESWGSNRKRMMELAERMGVPSKELRLSFFAGSMFWFRPAAFEPLCQLGLGIDDFEPEQGELDGHLHHALERLFPVAARAAGYGKRAFESEALAPLHGTRIGERRLKIISFYLPQFHPIPENDDWWEPGFTEWTNVTRAQPLYRGHPQPRLPRELGYTDLRLHETRQAQADLAREYGINGFCYYYYWFDGRRLLERPLQEVLDSGEPQFPFCICWANENWTRCWDGLDEEVLISQEHSLDSSRGFIHEVIPILMDPRYIRYAGKPVLMIYRANKIPDIEQTVSMWRAECRERGVGELHLCAVRFWDTVDVCSLGFDAAVDFPPHHIAVKDARDQVTDLHPDYAGTLYDYREVVRHNLETRGSGEEGLSHRAVMTAWDNTARRGIQAHIAYGATPELYGAWLRGVLEQEMELNANPESLIFINAWNEWAEGAVLEPDRHFGRGFLEATRDAVAQVQAQYEPEGLE
jgi:lipopolysaccharide biosynthesis protein